ncbi:MAG: Fe-S cluster assembly protein SufD [Pseudomonadota bacterium]
MHSLDTALLDAAIRELPNGELSTLREAAAKQLRASGLPTQKDEAWRYTNLAPAIELTNRWLADLPAHGTAEGHDIEQGTAADTLDAECLVIRDGDIDADACAATQQAFGGDVAIERLSQSNLGATPVIESAIASLNAALLRDALIVRVNENAVLSKPIAFIHDDTASETGSSSHARVIVLLERNAKADFIEVQTSSGAGEHFANIVTEFHVGERAHCGFLQLQQRQLEHMSVNSVLVHIDTDGRFEGSTVQTGGRLVRNNVQLRIDGKGAYGGMAGLTISDGEQHVDNCVFADHAKPNGTTRQDYRGIAGGKSRTVFNGKALVQVGADGTDAEQSNHNLLLSPKAEIDTKPELEIYADDVKCAHGATVGELDADALFYLRSRGLSADQAERVLTRAFAARMLTALENSPAAALAEQAVETKLSAMIGGRGQ